MKKDLNRLQSQMRLRRAELEDVAAMAGERIDLFATGLIVWEEVQSHLQLLQAKRKEYDTAQADYLAQVPY